MPITQAISSKSNIKKFTNNDITPQLDQPAIASYYATSTTSQTIINLPFLINTTATGYTDNFWLFVDGKKLDLGASNDYQFTNIASDGTSSQVTLTSSLPSGLNIQAFKLGLKPEIQFQLDNRIVTINTQISTAPTVQRFLSGSGTYTTPAGVVYIKVKMIGGGGSGGYYAGVSGSSGTSTTFGSSLLTCTGGGAGGNATSVGSGGSATVNSPAVALVTLTGGVGSGATNTTNINFYSGGVGGTGPFGGAGGASGPAGSGFNAVTNSGAGGGGGGNPNASPQQGGAGGGAGGYIEAIIANPSATYTYSVGTGGTGGGSPSGGNGGSGVIIVEEHYVG